MFENAFTMAICLIARKLFRIECEYMEMGKRQEKNVNCGKVEIISGKISLPTFFFVVRNKREKNLD